eukprot:scaffold126321_cov15-Prasinocladus_malaysianus.AAC.1
MSIPGTGWLRVSFEPPDVVAAPYKSELVGPGGCQCGARLHATGTLRSSTSTGVKNDAFSRFCWLKRADCKGGKLP